MYCKKCGMQLKNGANFCSSCGAPIDDKEQWTPQQDGMNETEVEKGNVKKRKSMTKTEKLSLVSKIKKQPCLAALIVCTILWLAAPFVAINIGSLYDGLPSAFQIVTGDISYIGELQESSAYWAAVTSGIGIVACIGFIIKKRNKVSRIIAIIAEIPILMTLAETYDWLGEESIGVGLWGIFILFLVVIVLSKKKRLEGSNPDSD